MASGFTEDSVRNFIIKNGCKVTNHELVTQFKSYLNDPVLKGQNRDKFKDFVNTLATIKVDEKNEKVLVLKKKYRPAEIEASSERATSEPPDKPGDDDFDGGGMSKVRSEGQLSVKDNVSETSSLQGSVDTLSVGSSNSQTSVDQVQSTQGTKPDDDVNASVISVKDRARHLNKIQSESELIKHQSDSNLRRKDRHVRDKENDAGEDDSHSSGIGYTSYTPEQKQWLAVCSSGEYHEIHRMVTKHPFIAKTKDFTSTALHWAAKHGNPEVCKLLLSRPGVEVDKRSGYTPLHLAAMHGHEHIIELLVQTYKADSNIRDYSGKKAKQYLRNSASTKAQRAFKRGSIRHNSMQRAFKRGSIRHNSMQRAFKRGSIRHNSMQRAFKRGSIRHNSMQKLLLTRRLGTTSAAVSGRSLDDSFTRTASFRKSNRARAISSLIMSKTAGMKNAMRSTWSGSADQIEDFRSRSPTPPSSSPSIRRRMSKSNKKSRSADTQKEYTDRQKMPPPSSYYRKPKKSNGVHSSKDSISSDDGVFHSNTVTRSESEPSLQTPRASTQTYV